MDWFKVLRFRMNLNVPSFFSLIKMLEMNWVLSDWHFWITFLVWSLVISESIISSSKELKRIGMGSCVWIGMRPELNSNLALWIDSRMKGSPVIFSHSFMKYLVLPAWKCSVLVSVLPTSNLFCCGIGPSEGCPSLTGPCCFFRGPCSGWNSLCGPLVLKKKTFWVRGLFHDLDLVIWFDWRFCWSRWGPWSASKDLTRRAHRSLVCLPNTNGRSFCWWKAWVVPSSSDLILVVLGS